VQAFQITQRDAFLLLACDGFWGERCWLLMWHVHLAEQAMWYQQLGTMQWRCAMLVPFTLP